MRAGCSPRVAWTTPRPIARANHVAAIVLYRDQAEDVASAVVSLLEQSHTAVSVVVVYLPATRRRRDPLRLIRDRRLIRLRATVDVGAETARRGYAAALDVADAPYLLTQGASDRSYPDRVAILLEALREEHAVAAVSAEHLVSSMDPERCDVQSHRSITLPLTADLRERGPCSGLFSRAALRRIGALVLGDQPGLDRLILHLLLMVGHIAYVDDPLYRRTRDVCAPPRVLEVFPTAEARKAFAFAIEARYQEAFSAYLEYVGGSLSVRQLATRIGLEDGLLGRIPVPGKAASAPRSTAAIALHV